MTTTSINDVDIVRGGFDAIAVGDLTAFAAGFHPDATWNHRNPDRLGGLKHGIDEILEFLRVSMELTAGTLRPVPQTFLSDADGNVAVVTRITATRPDGRAFDDTQILLFAVEDDRVRTVDQYIGDPPAVTAFWA
ncbi:nuclear transport factor 2 family protein [Kribbella sp. CA-245084]|uniref:nuclear transport factor 2 family protein n=1 Tax=Kribbella sp. CA-245084 TaxID=3239940 RepID=UPI003D89BF29